MKISGPGPVNAPATRRRERSRGAEGNDFASNLVEKPAPEGAASASQADALAGLLAAQEVEDDPPQGGAAARRRGEFLLDKLDKLRHSLLAGRIPRHQLDELMRSVRGSRDQVADPRIREVLGEIELRVAVELAKLGRSS